MSDRLFRVSKWEEFKRLVNELKPDSIVYNIEQTGISKKREFTSLRLIIPSKNYYVYVDFPKGNALRETGIPIHQDASGTRCIEDNDIKDFLKREFGELACFLLLDNLVASVLLLGTPVLSKPSSRQERC